MVLHLWCMTRLTILHLLCSTLRNRSCPKVMAVTTGIIIHFSFCAAASLYSSPCLHEICLYPAEWECSYQVQTEIFARWWWCWNECPLLDLFTSTPTYTRVCTHWRQPADPASCFIVNMSRLRGCRGYSCWQGLDCWGKDDGSSCRARIAVSWDPLEGVIGLLWNLLPIRPSTKQREGYRQMQSKVQVWSLIHPPIASSYLLSVLTHKHKHFPLISCHLYLHFSANAICRPHAYLHEEVSLS